MKPSIFHLSDFIREHASGNKMRLNMQPGLWSAIDLCAQARMFVSQEHRPLWWRWSASCFCQRSRNYPIILDELFWLTWLTVFNKELQYQHAHVSNAAVYLHAYHAKMSIILSSLFVFHKYNLLWFCETLENSNETLELKDSFYCENLGCWT